MNKTFEVIASRLSFKRYRIFLIVALCVGVIMIILSNKTTGFEQSNNLSTVNEENETVDNSTYNKDIERKLEAILREVNGVGEVKVFVLYETGEEKLVLKDSDGRGGENTVIFSEGGDKEPFIYKNISPQIGGVMVVSEGAENLVVKSDIADAVSGVLGIPLHKVKVLKMK